MSAPRQASLNYLEINLLLQELDLAGAVLRDVSQPRPEKLILGFHHHGVHTPLCFVMSQKACRFHLYTEPVKKEPTKQRFVSFLNARARDAVLEGIEHVRNERILKLILVRGGVRSFLWVRLWSSAPNIILTDATGLIGDALFRRPKKNEVSGGRYDPEEGFLRSPPRVVDPNRFTVRDFGGTAAMTLHEKVAVYFDSIEKLDRGPDIRERVLNELAAEERRLAKTLEAADAWLAANSGFERLRQYGDILMGELSSIREGAGHYRGRDFYNDNAEIEIELDPALSPAGNAEHYYRLYKKARGTHERTREDREATRRRLEAVRERTAEAQTITDDKRLAALAKHLIRGKQAVPDARPGLTFTSGDFTILVGRTARENDELFRRHVRGNDLWMHARDYPGASVFIKGRQGKSVPLDVLLDAANLALQYSKAKNAGKTDLYYTSVKYLKKAKGGPAGLFLPTNEKNIAVRLDPERITRLKGLTETFD
jgi:predicted ribosome quality control (RQC) complex YloA/Tae2 family protein